MQKPNTLVTQTPSCRWAALSHLQPGLSRERGGEPAGTPESSTQPQAGPRRRQPWEDSNRSSHNVSMQVGHYEESTSEAAALYCKIVK